MKDWMYTESTNLDVKKNRDEIYLNEGQFILAGMCSLNHLCLSSRTCFESEILNGTLTATRTEILNAALPSEIGICLYLRFEILNGFVEIEIGIGFEIETGIETRAPRGCGVDGRQVPIHPEIQKK